MFLARECSATLCKVPSELTFEQYLIVRGEYRDFLRGQIIALSLDKFIEVGKGSLISLIFEYLMIVTVEDRRPIPIMSSWNLSFSIRHVSLSALDYRISISDLH